MAETVELATIWLVDLVGSTRLATAVGPVRADALRDEYFALLRDAIDASGGACSRTRATGCSWRSRLRRRRCRVRC